MREITRTDMLIALFAAVLITIIQAYTGINGLLNTLVGMLVGAVGVYFGVGYLGKRKEQTQGREQKVPVGDSWRR